MLLTCLGLNMKEREVKTEIEGEKEKELATRSAVKKENPILTQPQLRNNYCDFSSKTRGCFFIKILDEVFKYLDNFATLSWTQCLLVVLKVSVFYSTIIFIYFKSLIWRFINNFNQKILIFHVL